MPKDFATCASPCMLTASGNVKSRDDGHEFLRRRWTRYEHRSGCQRHHRSQCHPKGTGINVTFAASAGTNEFRINLVDTSGMAWCYKGTAASGSAMVSYDMFQYQCWEGGLKTPYAKQPIASIAIQIIGGTAATAYSMTLKSVAEY